MRAPSAIGAPHLAHSFPPGGGTGGGTGSGASRGTMLIVGAAGSSGAINVVFQPQWGQLISIPRPLLGNSMCPAQFEQAHFRYVSSLMLVQTRGGPQWGRGLGGAGIE